MIPADLAHLRTLAELHPTADLVLAQIAALRASLLLPKPLTHVISDIHGEFAKLRHVINNASGNLRPLVAEIFRDRMDEAGQQRLLAVLYYPHELRHHIQGELADPAWRRAWVGRTLRHQFEVVRALARQSPRGHIDALAPPHFRRLFAELLDEPHAGHGKSYVDTMLETFCTADRDLDAVRAASRLVRNLAVDEIIVNGDLGDRGPRADKVLDYLMQQPHVSYTWGNHDASWMGACLGHEALICNVLRISLRYRRLFQLEEGYGLLLLPLENLARTVYDDDPANRFVSRNDGLRDSLLVARMQKAIAIMQLKLEGQIIRRHPEWNMAHRDLLPAVNTTTGAVTIDGKLHPLLDTHLPTLDPADPNALSPEERDCMDRLRQSFTSSDRLWRHMSHLARRGSMWLVRDHAVIFHGCIPVDPQGNFLPLEVDGQELAGRPLFTALDTVVRRSFRKGADAPVSDTDWLWYLWCGPLSPLFGKDRITTFENYFVADKDARHEHKNPYFELLHDHAFAARVAAEFGVTENGLVVNGHVPVKIEAGEQPVKRGGNAITIDGAFSEAYGDRGYTLLLAPDRLALAEHHHFDSVDEILRTGSDILPTVTTLQTYPAPRLVADTEQGDAIRGQIAALESLLRAYEAGLILERS